MHIVNHAWPLPFSLTRKYLDWIKFWTNNQCSLSLKINVHCAWKNKLIIWFCIWNKARKMTSCDRRQQYVYPLRRSYVFLRRMGGLYGPKRTTQKVIIRVHSSHGTGSKLRETVTSSTGAIWKRFLNVASWKRNPWRCRVNTKRGTFLSRFINNSAQPPLSAYLKKWTLTITVYLSTYFNDFVWTHKISAVSYFGIIQLLVKTQKSTE